MEALRFPETSVITRGTRPNIPEDGILHSHRSKHLKSYMVFLSGRLPQPQILRLETMRAKRTKLLCTLPFLLRCRDLTPSPNSFSSDTTYIRTLLAFLRSVLRLLLVVTANIVLARSFLSP
jgi:hypothetical protein